MRSSDTGRGDGLLCPSSRSIAPEAVVIGVVTQGDAGPRVVPTLDAMPVTPELLALAAPVGPSEVFRFASPCQSVRCSRFQNGACQLAAHGAQILEPVTEELPKCAIRPQCRWFRQEGAAICKRCPQIITDQYAPSAAAVQIVRWQRAIPGKAARTSGE
jgi:hypothetical protein